MRVFSADDVDAALDFPALIDELAEAMRGGFVAPHRHHHAIERAGEPDGDASPHARLDGERLARRPLSRRQDRQRLSRQFGPRPARGHRPLRAAVGPHRRDAGGDRRDAAHPLAHRRRLGARGAPSRAGGRRAPARRRGRGARAVPRPRPCERAAPQGDHGVEPQPRGRAAPRRSARRGGTARAGERRPRARRRRGRRRSHARRSRRRR